MRRLVSALFAVAIVASSPLAMARGGHSSYGGHHSGHSGSGHGSHHYYGHGGHHHDSHKVIGVPRNSHGRIKRSPEAKAHFKKSHPCPSTGRSTGACPGYVIDHINPLKRGGADAPSNMQWQTVEAAKLKDRTA